MSNTTEAAWEAIIELRDAENYLNEATEEQIDEAIYRYNAAEARVTRLLREAKGEMANGKAN
jgi:hypothetical protein